MFASKVAKVFFNSNTMLRIGNEQLREDENLHKVPYKVDNICSIWFKILKTHVPAVK